MTVNGNKNWQSRLAPPTSKIFTLGVVISSRGVPLTLRRSLEAIEKSKAAKPEEEREDEQNDRLHK